MRAYSIALLLFIFGFVSGAVNGMGIFDTALPSQATNITHANVTEITDGIYRMDAITPLSLPAMVWQMFSVVFVGLETALTIIPLALEYNIPIEIAMMLQGPIWFIYAWGIMQYFSGRSTKGMD